MKIVKVVVGLVLGLMVISVTSASEMKGEGVKTDVEYDDNLAPYYDCVVTRVYQSVVKEKKRGGCNSKDGIFPIEWHTEKQLKNIFYHTEQTIVDLGACYSWHENRIVTVRDGQIGQLKEDFNWFLLLWVGIVIANVIALRCISKREKERASNIETLSLLASMFLSIIYTAIIDELYNVSHDISFGVALVFGASAFAFLSSQAGVRLVALWLTRVSFVSAVYSGASMMYGLIVG